MYEMYLEVGLICEKYAGLGYAHCTFMDYEHFGIRTQPSNQCLINIFP